MSVATRVSATTGGAAASGWVVPTGRTDANGPIDPLSPTNFYAIADYWQRYFDGASSDSSGRSGFGKRQQSPYFTPLVGQRAAAFSASDSVTGTSTSQGLFLSDLRRAVSLYEFNLKLSGPSVGYQGTIVNRYS